MVLILRDDLLNPPSTAGSIRAVLLRFYCRRPEASVVVETEQELKDLYWRWMRQLYLTDFVSDLVLFGDEVGLRLDTRVRTYDTLVIDRIAPETEDRVASWVAGR